LFCPVASAWTIVGVLMEKSVYLSIWGCITPARRRPEVAQRQSLGWLKNVKIVTTQICPVLVANVFVGWGNHPIYLALDSSSV